MISGVAEQDEVDERQGNNNCTPYVMRPYRKLQDYGQRVVALTTMHSVLGARLEGRLSHFQCSQTPSIRIGQLALVLFARLSNSRQRHWPSPLRAMPVAPQPY